MLNPTLHRGWQILPPPQVLDYRAFHIILRGPRLWYNSYFIVTMDVHNVWNLKGVQEKNWSLIFEPGVNFQKFKMQKKILQDIL